MYHNQITMETQNYTKQLDWEHKTILMVNGEWITWYFIREYLGMIGKNARIISNTPKEVMEERFHDEPVDLIINVINPREVTTDYELTKKLRQRYKEVSMIVAGTINTSKEVKACYQAGCSQYLPLPIDLDGFGDMLMKYLGK